MQVFGGYILIGVNGDGTLSGEIDDIAAEQFDEARLTPRLQKHLPPMTLSSNVLERDGHKVAVCSRPSALRSSAPWPPGPMTSGS